MLVLKQTVRTGQQKDVTVTLRSWLLVGKVTNYIIVKTLIKKEKNPSFCQLAVKRGSCYGD
jgi:hypothetical protein